MSAHIPVLLKPMLTAMAPKADEVYLDGTFGAGGYSRALLETAPCRVIGLDRDPLAQDFAKEMQTEFGSRLHFIAGNFADMAGLLAQAGYTQINGIVLDLGMSSMQLDVAQRGFSYRNDGALDMRMSGEGQSAQDIIQHSTQEELAQLFRDYGEEKRSRFLARAIVKERTATPFTRTKQLADFIAKQFGASAPKKGHPAMRVFQALRIAVNDELGALQQALASAPDLLAAGGRLVIVSFHSLEDRLVKQAFAKLTGRTGRGSRHYPEAPKQLPQFHALTRKAVQADATECANNPRAQSARLRAVARLEGQA